MYFFLPVIQPLQLLLGDNPTFFLRQKYPILYARLSFICLLSCRLVQPPLDSETGWIGEICLKIKFLILQKSEDVFVLLCKKRDLPSLTILATENLGPNNMKQI